MFGIGNKKVEMRWDPKTEELLEQSLAQFPGPKMLLGTVKGKLRSAAEDKAKEKNHAEVMPEDLMEGLMGMLPASMRATIEQRTKEGPEGLKKLEEELKGKI